MVRTFSSHFYTSHLGCYYYYCQKKEMHFHVQLHLDSSSLAAGFKATAAAIVSILHEHLQSRATYNSYYYSGWLFFYNDQRASAMTWSCHTNFSPYICSYNKVTVLHGSCFLFFSKTLYILQLDSLSQDKIFLPFFHLQVQIEGQVWEAVVTTSAPTTSIRSRLKRPIFEAMTSSNQFKSTWE